MTDITIRTAVSEDLDQVIAIEAVCFPKAEAADRASFAHRLATFPDSFFVDEMYEDSSLHDPKGAYQSIFGLDVLPEYQRQGIAAKLMEQMIRDAKERGRKGLILTCKDRLIHYYEKFGYKNKGVSQSVHGGVVWYDMLLEFEENA